MLINSCIEKIFKRGRKAKMDTVENEKTVLPKAATPEIMELLITYL